MTGKLLSLSIAKFVIQQFAMRVYGEEVEGGGGGGERARVWRKRQSSFCDRSEAILGVEDTKCLADKELEPSCEPARMGTPYQTFIKPNIKLMFKFGTG